MIELRESVEGIILPVKALPGARQNAVRGEQQGALKLAVTPVAEKGKANRAILDLLAATLGVKKAQLELVAGPTSGRKEVLVRGVSLRELNERLVAVLQDCR